MKKFLVLSFFTTLISANVFALEIESGTYVQKSTSYVERLSTKAACKSEGGKWDADEKMCLMTSDDVVTVENKNGKYTVSAIANGFNEMTCSFKAAGKIVAVSEDYNRAYNSNDEYALEAQTDLGDDVSCSLIITARDTAFSKGLRVRTQGDCSRLCTGDRVSLDMARAKKID